MTGLNDVAGWLLLIVGFILLVGFLLGLGVGAAVF